MTLPTQWTWVWASSRRWWRTGKPGVLQSMGSQRVRQWLSNWTRTIAEFRSRASIMLLAGTSKIKSVIFTCLFSPYYMYGCESWTIKKAECQRIYVFELWCWRRLLSVPWTARQTSQSWIFIGRTDAEAETPILWSPDAKNRLIRKDPDAGKDWRQEEKDNRGWDGWMPSPTQWTWVWASSRSWW